MCDTPTYNQAAQPSYGEGLADALKAQVELLTGKGDFAEIAPDGLEGLLPLEESIRKKTAQTDTDVLRQTLLGNRQEETTGTYDDEGRLVVGFTDAETGEAVTGKYKIQTSSVAASKGKGASTNFSLIDTTTGKTVTTQNVPNTRGPLQKSGPGTPNLGGLSYGKFKDYLSESEFNKIKSADNPAAISLLGKDQKATTGDKEPQPIYAKDPNGNVITDKSKAGQTETIPASFSGDGMINLLGDSRNVQEFTTRQATQEDVAAGLASEVGESITEATGGRKAGFDAEGNFLGLAAFSEDLARSNLSRQREADLADVERLSDRYQDVMADYKPAATSGLDGARELLEEQKKAMTTGGGAITKPTGSTYGGDVTAATMTAANVGQAPTLDAKTSFTAAEVADPMQLTANTQFQGELATGAGNNDTLRSALLGDAKTALDTGLTDREQAQIANAARARQTLMGRTFDQSGAIAEAEARVQEDNARRMQNRSFAQSVLGQEAGLQQGDITRGMAQESEQAGLNQRRDLAQSQLDQDALRTSMLTGVQQDLDQAKFDQQRNLAQAELDQQANAFGAQSTQQARMANQAQRQQANQFGVGATMDAERLNETLRQQGLANYINAVGNLARMEDQYMLDPFQALLGRGGGGSLQAGQGVFGQAGYGLNSGPQYLNPEAGLGYISNMAANQADMYAASVAADASKTAGIFGGLGSLGGGLLMGAGAAGGFGNLFCWVAREVYGPTNPAWMQFREWMFTESPQWFFELYRKYGERFASWISDKPRLKGIIRKWMDSKIGDK